MVNIINLVKQIHKAPGVAKENEQLVFRFADNKYKMFFEQFTQFAKQKTYQSPADLFFNLMHYGIGKSKLPGLLDKDKFKEDGLKKLATNLSKTFDFVKFDYTDPDLKNLTQKCLANLKAGHRVIVIGHSQGCMYANAAYEQISKKAPKLSKSMCIIGIATPNNKVPKCFEYDFYSNPAKMQNMFYTTAKEDKIVNAVRKFFPTTVTANVSIPHATDTISLIDVFGFRILESDPLNHSLVDAYFKSEESLNNIKKGITYALKKLKFPGEPDKEPPANFTQYETNSNGSALIIHLEKKARRGHTFKIVSYSKGKRISSRGTIVSNNWMDMKYVLNYNEVPKDGLEMDIFLANKESWSPSFKTSCVLMIAGPDEVANRIHYRIPGGTYIKAAKVKITKNQGKVYISQQNFNVARN